MAKNQKYKVIVSDRAKQMLGAHIRFLAKVNKEASRRTKEKIMEALCSLSEMPQRYPPFRDIEIPDCRYRKMYIEKWYLVIFQIKSSTVEVDYIIDLRQDYSWLLSYQ